MFINKNLSICYEKPDYEDTRELSQEEIALIERGYGYSISYEAIMDISTTPEYIAKKQQEENERIAKLTMTALDFVRVLNSLGVTREILATFLEANPDLDDQLKYCQNVYCGVVCQLCPLTIGSVEITQEMVIQAFELKNSRQFNTLGEG